MDRFDKPGDVFRAKVDPVGRVLIPADTRHRLGIARGDELVVEVDERGIHLRTIGQAIQEAQALFATIKRPGESLVDELIRERRDEAARE